MCLIKQFAAQVDKARSIPSQHPLVTRGTERIDLHTLHVDLKHARRLGGINNQRMATFDLG